MSARLDCLDDDHPEKTEFSVYHIKIPLPKRKTRTGSVQKVCGGVWHGFDHLTKLESSKVEVVLR